MQLDDNTDISDLFALLFLFTTFIPVTLEIRLIYNVFDNKITDKIFSRSFMNLLLNGRYVQIWGKWKPILQGTKLQNGDLHGH